MANLGQPQQACQYCRRQKRKCDKQLPRCGTCRRASRDCEYSFERNEELVWLRARVASLEEALNSGSSANTQTSLSSLCTTESSDVSASVLQPSDILDFALGTQLWESSEPRSTAVFPNSYFLDTAVYNQSRDPPIPPFVSIPQELLSELTSAATMQEITHCYFRTVHSWLPIVWKRRIYQLVSARDMLPDPGLVVLLAAMRMVSQAPNAASDPGKSRWYKAVKGYISLLEDSGYLRLNLLQASILVAAYEVGHGIYLAGYMSIGRCARLGHIMGLHSGASVSKSYRQPTSWGEMEEIRRTWCAVLAFDRYTNIGFERRPLYSGQFAQDEILPCDTNCWDRGEPVPSQSLFVQAATALPADPFARTCQVAHLLGRIIDHRDDAKLVGPSRYTTAMQLLKTLNSLLLILENEVRSNAVAFSVAYAMAFSAKVTLLNMYTCTETNQHMNCVEETEMQELAIEEFHGIVAEIIQFGQLLRLTEQIHLDNLSPLICDCFYQAAATAIWYFNESGSEQMGRSFNILAANLRSMRARWYIAGEYLMLLESQSL